jgi:hypothetical protein
MLDQYTPYDSVPYNNPVLRRETRSFRSPHVDPWHLPEHGSIILALQIAGAMAFLGFCVIVIRSVQWRGGYAPAQFFLDTMAGLPFILVTVAQVVVTIGVDLYVAATTVAYWKARLGTEQWDTLRLAPSMSESQLVEAFHAAAQIRAWRPLWLETTTRLIPVMLAIIAVLFPTTLIGMCFLLAYSGGFGIVLLMWGGLLVAMLLGYVREPMLKMRANTAVCAMFAMSLRDTNAATLASIGAILAARLVLLIGWVLIGWVLVAQLSLALAELSGFLALALTLILLPLLKLYYGGIEQWSLRRAVQMLRRSE